MSYYSVLVELEGEPKRNGAPTKIREMYLVDAMSVTEAEARVVKDFSDSGVQLDYKVSMAKESRILRVIE